MQVIEMIADERRMLADILVTLTPEQLATPSLCGVWTVHDIAAHLLMPLVTRIADRPIGDIAQGLHDEAENPFSPPGMGLEAPLTDLLVHGQDLRRPLRLDREIPHERADVSLTFLTTTPRGFVPKDRLAGLALSATDLPFSFGSARRPERPDR